MSWFVRRLAPMHCTTDSKGVPVTVLAAVRPRTLRPVLPGLCSHSAQALAGEEQAVAIPSPEKTADNMQAGAFSDPVVIPYVARPTPT
jgi:hypothetical protein